MANLDGANLVCMADPAQANLTGGLRNGPNLDGANFGWDNTDEQLDEGKNVPTPVLAINLIVTHCVLPLQPWAS